MILYHTTANRVLLSCCINKFFDKYRQSLDIISGLPPLSSLSNSSILVSRQCESFRTLGQSFLAKNKACFCLSIGSLAAPTFAYLELRKRGTVMAFQA
jgi:hypothetical protein